MKLHPNYKEALEKRYSRHSLNEFVKEAEDSHLYIENKLTFIARTFYEEPKMTIIRDEYEESYYGAKYEGKVKEEFEIMGLPEYARWVQAAEGRGAKLLEESKQDKKNLKLIYKAGSKDKEGKVKVL